MTPGKTRVFGIGMVKSVMGVLLIMTLLYTSIYCEIFDISVSLVPATI